MSIGSVIAGFAWDPQIRGFLAVGVGVVVLMGSVYLLLATNVANRLGFLLAFTGLMGWMTIMGIVWWVFGIGMRGEDPSWQIQEVSFDLDEAVTGPASELRHERAAGGGPGCVRRLHARGARGGVRQGRTVARRRLARPPGVQPRLR